MGKMKYVLIGVVVAVLHTATFGVGAYWGASRVSNPHFLMQRYNGEVAMIGSFRQEVPEFCQRVADAMTKGGFDMWCE